MQFKQRTCVHEYESGIVYIWYLVVATPFTGMQKTYMYMYPIKSSLQCRRFVLELEIVNSPPSWNSPPYWFGKSGWGGGGEKWKKTPAREGCENEKHPLISCASLIFRK